MSDHIVTGQRLKERNDNVHIGGISIFVLIIVLCLAVLSVLTLVTAHSSLVLSERQAATTADLYRNEAAAQTFVAGLDEAAGAGGVDQAAVDALVAQAAQADGSVTATATLEGETVEAAFSCESGRTLEIAVTVLPDGGYRIDKWRMTAVENEEQPIGTLYSVNNGG